MEISEGATWRKEKKDATCKVGAVKLVYILVKESALRSEMT